jgi:hypothetical protein
MKTVVDARLASEASLFGLRFACDDCVHFSPEREPTCGHGWPVRLRRSALSEVSEEEAPRGGVEFCKEFELA